MAYLLVTIAQKNTKHDQNITKVHVLIFFVVLSNNNSRKSGMGQHHDRIFSKNSRYNLKSMLFCLFNLMSLSRAKNTCYSNLT